MAVKTIGAGFFAAALLTAAAAAPAQWVAPLITDAEVEVTVSYDPATAIYRYDYTVRNPSSSFGSIRYFWIDTGAAWKPGAQDAQYLDATGLVSDSRLKRDHSSYSGRAIPLGVETPQGWYASIGMDGGVIWIPDGPWGQPRELIDPGEVVGGLRLSTRVPPGLVAATVEPDVDMGPGSPYEEYGELCGEDNSPCPDPKTFWVERQVVGPKLPSEQVLIDGKGQRGTDVNTFLRYANPLETSVALPAGTRSFDLVVVFGQTILPESFQATLNGNAITGQFRVAPGGTAVVKLPLEPGRNVLVLSIDGHRDDGRVASDTDRLVFVVK